MTFIKKGVVIPAGASGNVDDDQAKNPGVVRFNDKIYCYYDGFDGSNIRICLAISEDGTNFTKKGVVVPLGTSGDVDDLYCSDSSVIKFNDKIYCYYTGNDGSNQRICLAIAEDGCTFVKKGVVIPLGSSGDADDADAKEPKVVEVNDKIYCYYVSNDGSYQRICLAISEDGVNFVKKGVVVPLGAGGDVDDSHVVGPDVVKVNDKIYCYYGGYGGLRLRVCLAISEDGFTFVKKGVVVPLGASGDVDDLYVYRSGTISFNDKMYCYYSGDDGGSNARVCLAISEDGF